MTRIEASCGTGPAKRVRSCRRARTRSCYRHTTSAGALFAMLILIAGALLHAERPATAMAREHRMALVIGNAAYPTVPLRNPVNDARAVAGHLRDLGFEVTLRENLNFRDMLDALQNFTMRARSGDVRLFFYAGHGVQVRGKNYLLPVDAGLGGDDLDGLRYKSAEVNEFVEKLERIPSGVNIVILDACRSAPATLVAGARSRGLGDRLGDGLAPMVAPHGTLIAFSTAPNSIALDGSTGNSPYARHLMSYIDVAGLPVEQLFKRVRVAVSKETQQAQIPWEASSLMGDFCFRPGQRNQCGSNVETLPP
jgi:uncharacterized caspase-like protein